MSEETKMPEQEQEEVLTVESFADEANSFAEHYLDTHKPAKMYEWNSQTDDYVVWNACLYGAIDGLIVLHIRQFLSEYDYDPSSEDSSGELPPVPRETYDKAMKLYKKYFKKMYDLFYPMLRSSLSFAHK